MKFVLEMFVVYIQKKGEKNKNNIMAIYLSHLPYWIIEIGLFSWCYY